MRRLGPETRVQPLVSAAHAQGRSVRVVVGGVDRHSAFVAFAEGLGLPDWFGHNLDALVDALRGIDDARGRPIEIVWDGTARLRSIDPASYEAICSALADVERERPDVHVTVVER